MNKKWITPPKVGLYAASDSPASQRRSVSLLCDLLAGLALVVAAALALRAVLGLPQAFVLSGAAVYATIAAAIAVWHPGDALSPADRVTLLRAVAISVLAGWFPQAQPLSGHDWWLVALATSCLLLDGVDGWVARRGATESDFGARFDMELDALLLVVLAAMAFALDKAGAWVLLIGALRYLFVAAGWLRPWLRATLPPSRRRKAVCVVQGVVLVAALAPMISSVPAAVALGVALALLCYSFILDTLWLWRRAGEPAETTPRACCTEQDS